MSLEQVDVSALQLDVNYGYLSRSASAPKKTHPQVIVNSDGTSMLRALREELKQSSSFTFSVAFISPGAIALLKQELVEYAGRGRIVTSDYLGFNSPAAFGELLNLARLGFDVRLHEQTDFHPKGYVFEHAEHVTAIVGSSNLTKAALVSNHEWNLRVSSGPESDLTDQFGDLVERQLANSVPLTQDWVDRYAEHYVPMARREQSPVERALRRRVERDPTTNRDALQRVDTFTQDTDPPTKHIVPNAMQQEALLAIDSIRKEGKRRAVVISATGTGKTILSALDVRSVSPKRLLFVVHREQILDRAIEEFRRVMEAPADQFGKLTGTSKQTGARYLFATVQTLARSDVLNTFAPEAFDYILLDEVHRAGAKQHRAVIDHFKPEFLLGMTATPERSDGFNVFELFDFNVPYEIRLNKALEADMLAPFHYYGVTDVEFADGSTIDELSSVSKLASSIRVNHIVDAITTYGHAGVGVRGLMFCSRKDEAYELSAALNEQVIYGHRLRTVALTGDDSIERRERIVEQLEAGELDYILTVDIFNEGVDIPSVNQVVMLRQTQSAIVFVQQLGRGLRKAPGKDYLVVIDFIGNYANNYLIPVALFGDESLNRESVRQHLVSAEEVGVIAGMSSVRFDRIAQARVLHSISQTKFDSWQNLKAAIDTLANRLGHTPALMDFLRFETTDPVVVATKAGNYPALVERLVKEGAGLTEAESRSLNLLSAEVLPAKRRTELLMLQLLLTRGRMTFDQLRSEFASAEVAGSAAAVESAAGTLTLDFHTEAERQKYVAPIVVRDTDGGLAVTPEFDSSYRESMAFRSAVDDLLATGMALVEQRYDETRPFTPGKLYSRKDACRLLRWKKNVTSTIYGYRVDQATRTCPIFVTLHKSDGITASTAYEDALLNPSTMLWYTRSRRTLQSGEVAAIVSNSVDLHVFAKKDDADGTNFYYLGKANAESPEQTTMPDDSSKLLSVVRMLLHFDEPVDTAIFDYFQPAVTI
ncbi:DUF3427 domain-containing protein [Agrococcus baldri]|uniref:Helicase n=1 Tax=Agrococcus baldri TaxID=153730 RepID=A0AA87RER5_9MICO|nr:DEAD/DEAH box helicase [Agrococcus baldri]GEK81351.1 helicase [Agrococcus baldri]